MAFKLRLHLSGVKLKDNINLNRREFGIVGKGGKERVVFISDDAAEWRVGLTQRKAVKGCPQSLS